MKALLAGILLLQLGCVTSMKPSYKYEVQTLNTNKKSHEVNIEIGLQAIIVSIKNNRPESLKLIPDECLLVDTDGSHSRLIDGRTLLLHRATSQPIVLIPGNSLTIKEMFPAEKYDNVFQIQGAAVPDLYSTKNEDNSGKIFKVVLNFRDFKDNKIEETYTFKITEKLPRPKMSTASNSSI